jgi:hypothetical protein
MQDNGRTSSSEGHGMQGFWHILTEYYYKYMESSALQMVRFRFLLSGFYVFLPSNCHYVYIVACFPGNATNNLWVLDLTLDLLDIHHAELQLAVTQSYCRYNNS